MIYIICRKYGEESRYEVDLKIIITEWALQSYLDLSDARVFTDEQYWKTIRPDVELLKNFPGHSKFQLNQFWSPATIMSHVIPNGFKMKWDGMVWGLAIETNFVCLWRY